MKVLLPGIVEDPKRFGGTIGTNGAELTDAIVDEYHLRESLEQFGLDLAKQLSARKRTGDKASTEVVGVNLLDISFTLILRRRPDTEKPA